MVLVISCTTRIVGMEIIINRAKVGPLVVLNSNGLEQVTRVLVLGVEKSCTSTQLVCEEIG